MKLKNITNKLFGTKEEKATEKSEEDVLKETFPEATPEEVSRATNTTRRITAKKTFKYRISSPENFKPDENIEHGTSILRNKIPAWAVDNSKIVIEKLK